MEHELDHPAADQEEDEIFPFASSAHPLDGFERQMILPSQQHDTNMLLRRPLVDVGLVTPPKSAMQEGTPITATTVLSQSTSCYDSPFGSSSSTLSDAPSNRLNSKLPDLTASVVSNKSLNSCCSELEEDDDDNLFRTTASCTSSMILSDSLHLESAASLLMQDSRNWAAAVEASTEVVWQNRKPTKRTANTTGFSQLLDRADDRMEQPATVETSATTDGRAPGGRTTLNRSSPHKILRRAVARLATVTTSQLQQKQMPQLPAVREETDSVAPSSDGSTSSRNSAAVGRDGESIVILSEGEEYRETYQHQEHHRPHPLYQNFSRLVTAAHRSQPERSMAALAGVTAVTTGRDTFVVSVRVCPNAADMMSSVLDALGNPELLPLWCGALDEFQHLVIVRRSEDRDANPNRAYEGEWVEATAPLVAPRNTGFVVRWTSALKSAFGGTNYGQISIFVERLAGRVSLTLGPFPGNVHVCHRLQISGSESDRILIDDAVRITRGDDDEDSPSYGDYCGLLDHCFLPTVQDYMGQVMVSLARLRFLLEQGEQSLYASAAMTLGQVASMSLEPNETDAHMTSPLLVGK